MDQKGPKTIPKMSQFGLPNDLKMVKMGPKWLRRGPEKGQGRKRSENESQKGVHGMKSYPLWGDKKMSKSIK